MNLDEIDAEQVMNTEPLVETNDRNLAQIKNTMEENEVRAIPVTDTQGGFKGVIGYRDLIRFIQFNPERTSLGKVMHQPPEFEEDDSLVELADLRINSGRKLMVCLENGELKGVVGDDEFIEYFKDAEVLEEANTLDVASHDLKTVFEEDSIEEARHFMLDNNISRVPVLDEDGKLTGIIRSSDILRMMVPRDRQDAGGTSGDRHGSDEVKMAGGTEKKQFSGVTADQMMREDPVTATDHMNLREAAEIMSERGRDEIIFLENGYPERIVTLKDIINYVEGFAPGKTMMVNLSGLELPEEKAAVHNSIKRQLQGSLGRKLDRPEQMDVHIKKSEKDGKKHRWELDMKLDCEYGLLTVNEEGWELLDAVDEALNELNSIVRKKHEKSTEHR